MTRVAIFAFITASILLVAGVLLGISSVSTADAANQTAMAITLAQS